MPINYEALRTGSLNVENPDDGQHTARLERAALVSTSNGERLVTEWIDMQGPAQWTSWNRFDEMGLSYTNELLDGLGVDRTILTDDDSFTAELDRVTGTVYDIRTASQLGSRGDGRVFVTTYVNGRNEGVQEALDVDVPVDRSDLQPPGGSAASKVSHNTDDIPF